MNKEDPKTQKIVYSGIMAAISVVLGLLATLLPFNTVVFLFAQSVVMCLVVQKNGPWWGIWTFGVTAVLMFLISSVHTVFTEYALLFGTYPTVKYLIERKQFNHTKEMIIKAAWGTLVAAAMVLIAHFLIGGETFWGKWYSGSIISSLAVFLLILPLEWLYDIALTYVLFFVNRRFRLR